MLVTLSDNDHLLYLPSTGGKKPGAALVARATDLRVKSHGLTLISKIGP